VAAETASPDILTLHAIARGDKPAVIDDRPDGTSVVWTFAELNERANRLANAMRGLGIGFGQRVIWCGRNSPDAVAMTHAARKIGATAVPLNYRLAPEEAVYVIHNSDAVLVWADAEHRELLSGIRDRLPGVRHVVIFGGEAGGFTAAEPWLAEAAPEDPPRPQGDAATMIYTSGTTGQPKGAVRRGIGNPAQVRGLVEALGYRPDDVYLTTGPLYHSGPGGFLGIAHALGQTVVLQRRFDAEDWLRLVDRYGASSTFSAPAPIRLVCHLPEEVKARYDRSSMRIMIANAAPWSLALKEAYLRDFPPDSLWEVYGSTELGVNSILRPEDQLRKPGSCGRPAPGVEIVLIGDDGAPVTKPNEPGELFVRSASVFDTYHKAQEKYESERRGELHTVGDVAYFDEEGFYYICDRKKDMIISGGMNIYPAEIEAALERHRDVFDVAVFGIPSDEWGESVHAVVVVRPGATLTEQQITAFAREKLASYKIPRSISFARELPRTGSGKILKRVLREPFWADQHGRV
jgi:fatty-acyl-CoA synthase/long-chain acyl-CoA synthetase